MNDTLFQMKVSTKRTQKDDGETEKEVVTLTHRHNEKIHTAAAFIRTKQQENEDRCSMDDRSEGKHEGREYYC